jgi:hypothetical protein
LYVTHFVPLNVDLTVPAGRYGHTAVEHDDWVYVFGGSGDTERGQSTGIEDEVGGELWRFSLSKLVWEQIHGSSATSKQPHPRLLHAACKVMTANGPAMLLHGGMLRQHNPVYKDDTWLFYFEDQRWELVAEEGPGDRYGATLVVQNNVAYLFGGVARKTMTLLNELWRYDADEGWTQVSYSQPTATLPLARNYHSMVAYTNPSAKGGVGANALYLFAGANCTGTCACKNDMWLFDLDSHVWYPIHVPDEPATRYHQTLVPHKDTFYAFGGESYKPVYMYHNSVIAFKITSTQTQGRASLTNSASVWIFSAFLLVGLAAFGVYRHRRNKRQDSWTAKRA